MTGMTDSKAIDVLRERYEAQAQGGGESVAWADLPWRAAAGWLRSASGSKIVEVGRHDGCISQRESELIAAAVNAYTAPPSAPVGVDFQGVNR